MRGSFCQKDNLITHILIELQQCSLLSYLAQSQILVISLYKVVFHKITCSKFMLIFPTIFLFWRWNENTNISWDFDTFTYVATCEMYVVTPRRRRLSPVTLQMFRGTLLFIDLFSLQRFFIFPQRIDTKNAKWRAAAMNFYIDVIRWFTNYSDLPHLTIFGEMEHLHNLIIVRNHVKLMHVINSRRGFSKGTTVSWILAMGLADLLGFANLHCQKVESTKWLKHKVRAMIGGQ